MEEDDVKLKTDDGKLTGGVATSGVDFGVGDDGVQQSDNSKTGVGDEGMGQKVVSLKGVHTESEIEKQQELDEVKKKAVTLGKTEAEIKKERELEEMKKGAVSLKSGSQSTVPHFAKASRDKHGSQSTVHSDPNDMNRGDKKGGETRKGAIVVPEVRTVITPEGRLVELKDGEKFADKQEIVNLKDAVQKKETGLDNRGSRNGSKNVVDLGSGNKKKSTPSPSFTKGGELKKSTPSPSFAPLRHPTSPSHFAKATRDEKLRGTRDYEGQAPEGNQGKSTPNPSLVHSSQFTVHSNSDKIDEGKKDELEKWEEQKVDLSKLSPEQRIDLQATPSLASVHQEMDDDLNGEVASWFDKYNELPINIKLGLGDTQTVQRAVKELADKFGVMTEEGLGEISRIVRDVYVDLIGESEIKKRAVDNLKITDDKLNDFLEEIAKIVALVREIGNKKTDEYFEKLSVAEILEKYPKIAEQDVTTGDIFDKKQQKYIAPTLKNWVDDYINNAGSDKHTSLERGKYLEESHNTKYLDEDDRRAVDMLTKSYDTGSKLLVDPQENVIYWRLHTDESGLGINSDKSKRVINHFKIEEAQEVDVDQGVKDNLEKEDKSSIIESEKDTAGSREDVLDLSTELGKNKNLGS